MSNYTKAIVAVIGAAVAAVQIALTGDNSIDGQEWTTIVIAVVTAVGVYFFPNKPTQ